jgi:hypothetical protein
MGSVPEQGTKGRFGPKGEELAGEWIELLHELYLPPNITVNPGRGESSGLSDNPD